jgi:cytochrome c2
MARKAEFDLTAIEKELNTDAKALAAFMKNPATYLGGKGMQLTTAQKRDVKNLVADMKKAPKVAEGFAVAALKPKIRVTISITVRF